MNLNRNFPRNLTKSSGADLEGSHILAQINSSQVSSNQVSSNQVSSNQVSSKQDNSTGATVYLPEDFLVEDDAIEAVQADLYPEILPAMPVKKYSSDYLHSRQKQRQKVRQIAEARLTRLSEELLKLADEVRYYHPLMAEAIDDAWDATEEAINLMTSET